MRFRLPMIRHGLGPGGRFCLWAGRKLKSFERRAAAASHTRAKTTQEGASIGGDGGGVSLRNGGLFISKNKIVEITY